MDEVGVEDCCDYQIRFFLSGDKGGDALAILIYLSTVIRGGSVATLTDTGINIIEDLAISLLLRPLRRSFGK